MRLTISIPRPTRSLSLSRVAAHLLCTLFAGCAGFGIVASSDPITKLDDAEVLFTEENRPLPAEKLIQEAIAIYKQRDDAHGLGNAYREYADFLESPAVTAWNSSYNRLGNFHDETINTGDRQTVAAELYRRALSYYERAETECKTAQQYDALTNVYVNMAWSHWKLGEI